MRKAYAFGKITKDKINKLAYSKFPNIDNDVKVSMDDRRIMEDEVWDGLKEYVINTSLTPSEAVAHYGTLVVENAFRMSKGTLATRPVFHLTEKRTETHVWLSFVAYKLYKELERIIAALGMKISVDNVIKIAKTITTIRLRQQLNNEMITHTMMLTPEHQFYTLFLIISVFRVRQ